MITSPSAPVFRTSEKLVMFGAFVLAVALGRQFAPQESVASPLTIAGSSHTPAATTPGKLLGSFAGKQVTVLALATGRGVRYEVIDGAGNLVADDLDREDLAARFPEADLSQVLADGGEPAADRALTPDPR